MRLVIVALLIAGCGNSTVTPVDFPDAAPRADAAAPRPDAAAARPDASAADDAMATADDAAARDASAPDATAPDAASSDASAPDAAPSDAGISDGGIACERATVCTGDLSTVGLGDFSVAFKITTNAAGGTAVISQRRICMHTNFWDIRMSSGRLGVEIEGPNNYASFTTTATVNSGLPHDVQLCRKAGRAYIFIDGVYDSERVAPGAMMGLDVLRLGTSPCVGFDGTQTLTGTVTDVCVGSL